MTNAEIEELAHRMAWRYRKSSDPHHSDTYTFNAATVHQFVRKLIAAEREECAKVCDEMAEAYGDNSAGRALGIAADKMRSNV